MLKGSLFLALVSSSLSLSFGQAVVTPLEPPTEVAVDEAPSNPTARADPAVLLEGAADAADAVIGAASDVEERNNVNVTTKYQEMKDDIHVLLDDLVNSLSTNSTPSGDGFQYTNIRLESSTPVSMIQAAENQAINAASAGSWSDRLPWKKNKPMVPVPAPVPNVSGVSGGVSGGAGLLSAYDGVTPPVNPQSEAEMLLAKQQLLMALLADTEEALAAGK